MATDATGTPSTNWLIPKFLTSADAPSGKGLNAIVDYLDTLLKNKFPGFSSAITGTPSSTTYLRGDGSWSSISAGPVTTLPGSPTDGQQVILTDNTADPTYAWLLQYNSTAAKWVFIGGSPLMWQVATLGSGGAFTTTSSFAVDVPGATVTVPHTGTYIVEAGGYTGKEFSTDIGGVGWLIKINEVQAGERAVVYTGATFTEVGGVNKTLKQTLTSGWIVKLQATSNGSGIVKMEDHYIKLTPITLS